MSFRSVAFLVAGTCLLMGASCGVPKEKHETTVAKLQETEQALADAKKKAAQADQRAKQAEEKATKAEKLAAVIKQRLAEVDRSIGPLREGLESCKAHVNRLTGGKKPGDKPPMGAGPAEAVVASTAGKILGTLSAAKVNEGMAKIMKRIRRCYVKRVIKKGLKVGGKLTANFKVNRKGRVKGLKLSDVTLKSSKALKCIKRVVKKARFSRTKGATTVSYSYTFIPPR